MWKHDRTCTKVRPNSQPDGCGRVALWKGKVGKSRCQTLPLVRPDRTLVVEPVALLDQRHRLDRRLSERAAVAATPPPIPTAAELATVEAEREEQSKTLARERQRRYRQRAERVPEPERRKRSDRAETREEWLIRSGRAPEEPEKYVFRASAVKAGSLRSRGYDHQDKEECAELALNLLRWGDVIALPQAVLERALRDNDPYRYEQPLDLDVYAARYAEQLTR
jgi:hypothetical protein